MMMGDPQCRTFQERDRLQELGSGPGMALVTGELLRRELLVLFDECWREGQETDVVQEGGEREIPEFVPVKAQSQSKTVRKVGRAATVSPMSRRDALDESYQFTNNARDRAPMDAAGGWAKIK
jgi:hypothetical protein